MRNCCAKTHDSKTVFQSQRHWASAVPLTTPAASAVPLTNATAWRAAHERLYRHLCARTPDKPDATLEDLQPLYQAVAHGCQAGWYQEAFDKVYTDRIQRGMGNDGFYPVRKLGALGCDLVAISHFFVTPWSLLSTALSDPAKACLLNEAGFRLRALGRLTEALDPIRAGLENFVKQDDLRLAAVSVNNLSELEQTLGEVTGAVGDASRSVTYADRSRDAFWRMGTRTTHADALHQAGRRAEAEALFREAEQMQAERQPAYPLLYSPPCFQYCDLLLAAAERAAWQIVVFRSAKERSFRGAKGDIEDCRDVSERAMQTLPIAERNNWLLDIALEHLTLGRAALYAAILNQSKIENQNSQIDQAVSGLRRAGTVAFLVRGLLTGAWLRSLTSAWTGPESAQSDLDEAWEIAERGPMPLFMADIHLYRARLFGSLEV